MPCIVRSEARRGHEDQSVHSVAPSALTYPSGPWVDEDDEDLILPRIIKSVNDTRNENMILLGDFNFRKIYWQAGGCSRPIEQTFIDTINGNLWVELVDEPTRGENILDLNFPADTSQVLSCETPPLGRSDHNIIKLLTQLPDPRIASQPRKILYSKSDYDRMNEMLKQADRDKHLEAKT